MMMKKLFFILLYLSIAGCSFFNRDDGDEANNWTLERLYSEAKRSMMRQNYSRAIELYEFLETRYPFGVYGQQALLDLAYVYYKMGDHEQSLSTTDRFIRLYPQNPYVDYAFYLQGLVNFSRNRGLTERFFPSDMSMRDVTSAYNAFQNFSELLARFPDSRYAEDSAQRMVYLRNILASHEIHVASYYLRRGAYVAAINRARFVVENFSRSTAVPDAMLILVKAYTALDLHDLAGDTVRVLRLNYPSYSGLREAENLAFN